MINNSILVRALALGCVGGALCSSACSHKPDSNIEPASATASNVTNSSNGLCWSAFTTSSTVRKNTVCVAESGDHAVDILLRHVPLFSAGGTCAVAVS